MQVQAMKDDKPVMLMTVDTGMRVLVLDDEKHRHDWFKGEARELGWVIRHAWTAEDAIRALDEGPRFDLVFLDHDLAQVAAEAAMYATAHSWGPDGKVVARHLAGPLGLAKRPGHVHVHSWNWGAAEVMEAILKDAGLNVSRYEFGRFKLVRRVA